MLFSTLENLYQDIRRRLIIEDSTTRDQIYRDLEGFGFEPRSSRHAKELWRSLMLDILMAIQPYYNMLKNNQNDNNRNYRRHVHHHRHYEMKEDHDYRRPVPRDRQFFYNQVPTDTGFVNEQVPREQPELHRNVRAVPVESEQEEFTRLVTQIAPQVFGALFQTPLMTSQPPQNPQQPQANDSTNRPQNVPIPEMNFMQILDEALRATQDSSQGVRATQDSSQGVRATQDSSQGVRPTNGGAPNGNK